MNLSLKKVKIISIFILLTIFMSLVCGISYSQEVQLTFASYCKPATHSYPIIVLAAELGKEGIGENVTVISPGGAQATMAALYNNEVDVAAIVGDAIYEYIHNTGPWEEISTTNNVRALYTIDIGDNPIAVNANEDIYNVSDLEGRRVFLGFPGSTHRANAEMAILKALEIDVIDVVGDLRMGIDAMKDGRAVGFVKTVVGTSLDASHIEMMTSVPLRIIGFTEEQVTKIQSKFPWLSYRELPKDFYSQLPNNDPVIVNTSPRIIACQDTFSEEYAYNWTKYTIENWDKFVELNPLQMSHDPLKILELMTKVDQLFLHPGAIRYYREKGVKVPEELIPPEMK